jgi:hypothetical protein
MWKLLRRNVYSVDGYLSINWVREYPSNLHIAVTMRVNNNMSEQNHQSLKDLQGLNGNRKEVKQDAKSVNVYWL